MNSKRLLILRGLPGSGKSAYAASLFGATVLNSDAYFMVGGAYRFDPSRLSLAHEWNQWRCSQAMGAGVGLVVIDNTNTRKWEMEPYKALARRHGYTVEEKIIGTDLDATACHSRNIHGVPLEIVKAMAARFEQ